MSSYARGMSIPMPKNIKEERLRWVLPIYNKQIKLVDLAKVCPHSQRSLERWLSAYKQYGLAGLEPNSTRPKTNPRETPIHIKERIIELRRETKLGAQKLRWKLLKKGIYAKERTINNIIRREGLVRKYRVRKIKYRYVKAVLKPGELIEIDVKWVPGRLGNKRNYRFTAIDCASRWRYLRICGEMNKGDACFFLRELVRDAPFKIKAIKTDNGSCFTNRYTSTSWSKSTDPITPKLHIFDKQCYQLKIEYYLIDPGKPAQNGKVECSHRTDQEMFYNRTSFKTLAELQYKIKLWNMYYNNLEHCAHNGLTPNEYLSKYLIN